MATQCDDIYYSHRALRYVYIIKALVIGADIYKHLIAFPCVLRTLIHFMKLRKRLHMLLTFGKIKKKKRTNYRYIICGNEIV